MTSTLLTVLYGIFSLGILIMVHELGHFIAGKLTGIRVTAFSIGFGRGIFSFDYKGTHYKIGWMPIGGYCRFAGEGEDLSEDRKGEPDEFYERPAWARLITVSAGVFFNFVFGILLYWVLALAGSSYSSTVPRIAILDEPLLRYLSPATVPLRPEFPALAAGLKDGDLVVSLNGRPLASYRDLQTEVLTRGAETLTLQVRRGGTLLTRKVVTGLSRRGAGYLNITTWAPPVLSKVEAGSPAAKAGLLPGDRILAVAGTVVRDSYLDLFRLVKNGIGDTNTSRTLPVVYSRRQPLAGTIRIPRARLAALWTAPSRGEERLLGFRISLQREIPGLQDGDRPESLNGRDVPTFARFREMVAALGSAQTAVLVLEDRRTLTLTGSQLREIALWQEPAVPAGGAPLGGLVPGDLITAVDGKAAGSVHAVLRLAGRGDVAVVVARWVPARTVLTLPRGASTIGIRINPAYYEFPTPPLGVFTAFGSALEEFQESFSRILKGLSVLFRKGVNISESTGGPLSLIGLSGKVLKESSFKSWLELLALLSVAIGFMNLLPIPALDGGHILLTIVEMIRRKRMSFKVLHRIQFAGVVILFTLFFLILAMDILKIKTIF